MIKYPLKLDKSTKKIQVLDPKYNKVLAVMDLPDLKHNRGDTITIAHLPCVDGVAGSLEITSPVFLKAISYKKTRR